MRRPLRLCLVALAVTCSSVAMQAQTFAVTSVKPFGGDPGPFGITFDGGHARLWNISAADMLRDAFGLTTDDQLPGLPDWGRKDRWEINATIEPDVARKLQSGPLDGRIALMHRMVLDLLHDRFALKETETTRVLPAYALTVAKSGAKLTRSGPPDGKGFRGMQGGNGKIIANGATIKLMVMRMSVMPEVQGHPIVDQTGLTGEFNWTLTWTPELSSPNPDAADAPGLFEALQQQLGLKLAPEKTAVPAVRIDSISRPTAD